jgi:hypothetical protein
MGNIIGAPAPAPEPERREEDDRPRNQVPEVDDRQLRNIRPVNIGALRVPRCLHYTRLDCGRGNRCPFIHEGDDPQHQAPRPLPNIQQPNLGRPIEDNNLQIRRVCREFAQGRCYRGAQCRFLHDMTMATFADNQVRHSTIDSLGHIS